MSPKALAAIGAALIALALPAEALAGSVNVNGSGALVFQTARSATTFATTVRGKAKIKLVASSDSSFRPVCQRASRKRCVRYDRVHRQWVVLRPVKFYYSGSAFKLTVRAKNGFAIGVTGRGRLNLNGTGTYTQDGASTAYDGVVHLLLK